jgi:hypothetical protein
MTELLDVRAAITHPVLEEFFFGREGFIPDTRQGPHPRHSQEEKKKVLWVGSGCPVRICCREGTLPFPSVLLANVQSINDKISKLQARISYQVDILKTVISYISQSRGGTTT